MTADDELNSVNEQLSLILWETLGHTLGYGSLAYTSHVMVEMINKLNNPPPPAQNQWKNRLNPFNEHFIFYPSNLSDEIKKFLFKLASWQTQTSLLHLGRGYHLHPRQIWNALYPSFKKFSLPLLKEFVSQPIIKLLEEKNYLSAYHQQRTLEEKSAELISEACARTTLTSLPIATQEGWHLNAIKLAQRIEYTVTPYIEKTINFLRTPISELLSPSISDESVTDLNKMSPPYTTTMSNTIPNTMSENAFDMSPPPTDGSYLARLDYFLNEGIKKIEAHAPAAGEEMTKKLAECSMLIKEIAQFPENVAEGFAAFAQKTGLPLPLVYGGVATISGLAYYGLTYGWSRLQQMQLWSTQSTTLNNDNHVNNQINVQLVLPTVGPGSTPSTNVSASPSTPRTLTL